MVGKWSQQEGLLIRRSVLTPLQPQFSSLYNFAHFFCSLLVSPWIVKCKGLVLLFFEVLTSKWWNCLHNVPDLIEDVCNTAMETVTVRVLESSVYGRFSLIPQIRQFRDTFAEWFSWCLYVISISVHLNDLSLSFWMKNLSPWLYFHGS